MRVSVGFQPIVPEPMKEGVARLYLLSEIRKVGVMVRKDFEKTTDTWKRKVKFKHHATFSSGQLAIEVYTDDPIYGIVSEGTPSRTITPKRKKAIRIPGTYTAKTVPGVLSSKSGGYSGDEVIVSVAYDHKIEPRKFDETVGKEWEEKFGEEMSKRIEGLADHLGYAI
jgi:hypothetical protein